MSKRVTIDRSTEGIRDFIFDEMERLANGETDIERLKVMSKAGDTILKSAAIDLQARRMLSQERGSREPKQIADLNLNIMLTNPQKMVGQK